MSKPIVSLSAGNIQGEWIAKRSLASFKGIPYAKPPVGKLRFQVKWLKINLDFRISSMQ